MSTPREPRAAEPDAEVEGLWLTAPAFPKDARLLIFSFFSEDETATCRRWLDERLAFGIRRSSLGETKTPEEMKRAIEARVEENGGDKGGIEFDMVAEGFVETLGYP